MDESFSGRRFLPRSGASRIGHTSPAGTLGVTGRRAGRMSISAVFAEACGDGSRAAQRAAFPSYRRQAPFQLGDAWRLPNYAAMGSSNSLVGSRTGAVVLRTSLGG